MSLWISWSSNFEHPELAHPFCNVGQCVLFRHDRDLYGECKREQSCPRHLRPNEYHFHEHGHRPGHSFTVIARLDAWAPDPHLNVRARKYPGLGHLPPEVGQHHVHRFEDNAKLGLEAFGADNLPLAAPIADHLDSYRDFLRAVGAEFNIEGLDQLKPPDWSGLI
jgi:hypothetical protein